MGRARKTLVVVAFTLVSCSSQVVPAATPTSNSALLRVYATTSVIPLANELTIAYSQIAPNITFDIATGNYDAIVEQVINSDEPAYFISNHLPSDSTLWAAPIGQDGIAVIVNRRNPVTQITTEQLRDIFQGRVANWRELGGLNQAITVISREDGSGTRAEFERLVMGTRRTTRSAQIAPSSAAMVTSVASLSGGIGYVSMSYLSDQVQPLIVNGITPTLDMVTDNSYPLRSTLFIIGMDEPFDDYRGFIGWVQSPDGQVIVARRHAPLLQQP